MPRLALAAAPVLAFALGIAQEPVAEGGGKAATERAQAAARVAQAAAGVLELLTPEQRSATLYAADAPQRLDWHFTPRERPGLLMKDMRPDQRAAVEALLAAALGPHGARQVAEVRALDDVLRWQVERDGGRADHRDSLLYSLAVFGEPAARRAWSFRFEGHHVSITVSFDAQGNASFSPCFLGASPMRVAEGPRTGLRPLAAEQDLGLRLRATLTPAQLERATVAAAPPSEVLLPPGAELRPLEPAGLPARELDAAQRELLGQLIGAYLEDASPDLLDPRLRESDAVSFGWAGGQREDELHFYLVQSPRMLIEFVTVQGNVGHVHAYWRDLERDLTRDWR